jgi:hypothetical protein
MTSERAQAYGRVMRTLREVGSSKLLESEQEQIRHAADTLLFSEDSSECSFVSIEVTQLAQHLVDSGRWSQERADQLVNELAACGPVPEPSQA